MLSPTLLAPLADRARAAGVFAEVRAEHGSLVCPAKDCGEPAFYSVREEDGKVWVALQTPARYLSQSIEADLMFTGDKIADLVHEEMMDQGYARVLADAPELPVEHFRSPDKLYTFRSALPLPPADPRTADLAAITLLGYQAAFRELGDMTPDEE
ncbi:MAG: hypothetical protein U0637_05850 [Phycisphaerales bacterium]